MRGRSELPDGLLGIASSPTKNQVPTTPATVMNTTYDMASGHQYAEKSRYTSTTFDTTL